MLTGSKRSAQIDTLWDKLWAGGLSNPISTIERFSHLHFVKWLHGAGNRRGRGVPISNLCWILN